MRGLIASISHTFGKYWKPQTRDWRGAVPPRPVPRQPFDTQDVKRTVPAVEKALAGQPFHRDRVLTLRILALPADPPRITRPRTPLSRPLAS
jgi:hypothetical protein